MHLSAAELLANYGYWAVLVGTFCEGETMVVAGAWAASQGYLSLLGVAACAWVGSFAGDQFYFLLGRWVGKPWLARRPKWSRTADRVMALLSHYRGLFIVGFRFLYGLRTIAPLVLGASGMPVQVFLPLNFLGAGLWAASVALGGAALVRLFALGSRVLAGGQVLSAAFAVCVALLLWAATFLPAKRR